MTSFPIFAGSLRGERYHYCSSAMPHRPSVYPPTPEPSHRHLCPAKEVSVLLYQQDTPHRELPCRFIVCRWTFSNFGTVSLLASLLFCKLQEAYTPLILIHNFWSYQGNRPQEATEGEGKVLEIATLGVNKLIHNEATYHMFVLMAVRENDLIAVATLCAYLLFHSLTLSLFLLAPVLSVNVCLLASHYLTVSPHFKLV